MADERLFRASLTIYILVLTISFSFTIQVNETFRIRPRRENGESEYSPPTYIIPDGDGGDGWGPWEPPSACSKTCGGGVASQARRCYQFSDEDGTPLCEGGSVRYYSCNIEDCPSGTVDFRSEQCSFYNNISYDNTLYQWVPYTKAPNPCELNCMPKGERFYYRHSTKVIDGTLCDDESSNICVDGECQPVGCDKMLGSDAREDKCRQCGGDNSDCNTISEVYDNDDLIAGYNDIFLIPQGATNILVKERRPSYNYLAIRNREGKYHLNGNWKIDNPHKFTFSGCIWNYERSPHGFAAPDSVRCLGPTTEAVFIVLLYQETNVGVQYEYSLPQGVFQNVHNDYIWINGNFTPCSVSCGGGTQTREVTCVLQQNSQKVSDNLCDSALRPADNQVCANIPCAPNWSMGEWSECNAPCGKNGTQSRQIFCYKMLANGIFSLVHEDECIQTSGPKPALSQKCNIDIPCPAWHIGPWNPCDKLCGQGTQRRSVICYQKINGQIEVLEDEKCTEDKPENEKECFIQPCEGVDWVLSEWSGCDSCVAKVRTRSAHCATEKGTVFPSSFCDIHPEPVLEEECDPTKLPACDAQWYTSQWSKCSGTCGNGVQSRRVFCGIFNGESLIKVPDEKCQEKEKYNSTKPCELDEKDCPAEWHAGPWTECSKSCGSGQKTRKLLCLRENKVVPVTQCDQNSILESFEQCNTHACTDDEVIPVDIGSTQPYDDDEEWCEDDEDDEDVDFSLSAEEQSEKTITTDEMMMSDGVSDLTTPYGSGDGITGSGDGDISTDKVTSSESSTMLETSSEDVSQSTLESSSAKSTEESASTSDVSTETMSDKLLTTDMTGETTSESTLSSEIMSSSSKLATDSSEIPSTGSSVDEYSTHEYTTAGVTDISTQSSIDDLSTKYSTTDLSMTDSSTMQSSTASSTDTSVTDVSGTNLSSTDISSTDVSSTDVSSTDISSTDISSTDVSSTDISSTDISSTDASSTDASSTDISSTDLSSTVISTESSSMESTTLQSSTSGSTAGSATSPEFDEVEPEINPKDEDDITEDNTITSTLASQDTSTSVSETTIMGETSEYSTTEISTGSSLESTSESVQESESTISITSDGSSTSSSVDETSTDFSSTVEITSEVSSESSVSSSATTVEDGTSTTESISSTSEESSTSEGVSTEFSTSEGVSTEFSTSEGVSTEFSTSEDLSTESSATDMETSSWGWSISTLEEMVDKEMTTKKCKKRPKKSDCSKSKFGCCSDKKTIASGPFEEGCPKPETCKETKYGCCPDNLSPAKGRNDKGCPKLACKETLFGCCDDNVTPAKGNNQSGCPPPPPKCAKSKYGCCADNEQEAKGPKKLGCPETEKTTTQTTKLKDSCKSTEFGCCDDEITPASGLNKSGCPCSTTKYGCCPDLDIAATGPNNEGCMVSCATSDFGCCSDRKTPAHGPLGEGCCLKEEFGCCPNNIMAATGPNLEGCGCQLAEFGCCPDNVTYAKGPENEGCECKHTRFGCCPNRQIPAVGPNFEGCPCYTYQFGCCPDGKRVAQGPRNQGCSCSDSEFGCCLDGETPAEGPDKAGCNCGSSKWGCCLDGVTEAKGEEFEGCEDKPANLQESCQLVIDRGPCKNYSVRWYYDMDYGGCSRFWYGGCEGNNNRFKSQEECQDICVKPPGKDVCKLPQVKGPCEGYFPTWYYDTKSKRCGQFAYGGCLGNDNRFELREQCENLCSEAKDAVEPCAQEISEGECNGNFLRWGFDSVSKRCRQFRWGGCGGNSNRFATESTCMLHCDTPGKTKDACLLPRAAGNCSEMLSKWYFDREENRCMPFYYTGCDGNDNQFGSESACDMDCPKVVAPDVCTLPSSAGDCDNYVQKWYYDTTEKGCRLFYYGGCGGNDNNFETEEQCESRCSDKHPVTTKPSSGAFQSEYCFLPSEAGSCTNYNYRWYYNNTLGSCMQFVWGGCEGNQNNFADKGECEEYCSDVQDLCQLPMLVGPCNSSIPQWFYDKNTDTCSRFAYGGCQGNNNRFESRAQCEQRCKKGPIEEPKSSAPIDPRYSEQLPDICYEPYVPGNCRANIPLWFYDVNSGRCENLQFTGCGGNSNQFVSEEQCERKCGRFRNLDVCRYGIYNDGSCQDSQTYTKYYYNETLRQCNEFVFDDCFDSPNRFSSNDECNSVCIQQQEPTPEKGEDEEISNAIYVTERPRPTASESADPCDYYKRECERLQCRFGKLQSVQNDGCERCTCNSDPCGNVHCDDDSVCTAEYYRDDYTEEIKLRGVCRLINKLGECPLNNEEGDQEDCEAQCYMDSDCPDDKKCCKRGCRHQCIQPVMTHPQTTVSVPFVTHAPGVQPAKIDEEQEPEVSAEEGNVAIMRCLVYGNPAPTVTWSKDAILIDGSIGRYRILTDGALQIISVFRNDSGVYVCVAENGIGKPVRKEFHLIVKDPEYRPANIVELSNNVIGSLGSSVVLRCLAYGWPAPTVQWWHGSNMLPIQSQQYERRRDYSLLIRNLQLSSLGEYTCQAYNGIEKAVSWTVTVRAVKPVNMIDTDFAIYQRYLVVPRQAFTTTLEPYIPEEEEPSPEIIPELPPRAYNVPVSVNITTDTYNRSAYPIGSDLSLNCLVDGYPAPQVRWLKDNYLLNINERIHISENHQLTINNINITDSGTYRCEARNQYDFADSSVHINVEGIYIHPNCTDNPYFANCKLIVAARYCNHVYYARFCCRSCTEAGQISALNLYT